MNAAERSAVRKAGGLKKLVQLLDDFFIGTDVAMASAFDPTPLQPPPAPPPPAPPPASVPSSVPASATVIGAPAAAPPPAVDTITFEEPSASFRIITREDDRSRQAQSPLLLCASQPMWWLLLLAAAAAAALVGPTRQTLAAYACFAHGLACGVRAPAPTNWWPLSN